jgi:chemotaxis protein CheD
MAERLAGFGLVVGVGDLGVGRTADAQIVTYALGSCIGVAVFDPVAKIGGMLHFMLPQPAEGSADGRERPALYATTGLPLLFQRLQQAGAVRERCVVCAAGGAEIIGAAGAFAIGKRNRTILRKLCWKDGTALAAEDVGNDFARTLVLSLVDGAVRVRAQGAERVLWAPGQPIRPTSSATRMPSLEGT